MSLTTEISNALDIQNPTQRYNTILQIQQQSTNSEMEAAVKDLTSYQRNLLRQIIYQIYCQSGEQEDLILALNLSPISDISIWLQQTFEKQKLEYLTLEEFSIARQEIESIFPFTDSELTEPTHVSDGDIFYVEIDAIRLDGATQARESCDEITISEYQQDLAEGVEFPPVIAFYDGEDLWLADGFHRYYAHQRLGREHILTKIHLGTRRDAILYAVGANITTHGLRRNNSDKRQAVLKLLEDQEWSQWSDRQIAKQCGVSQPTVSKIRKEVTDKIISESSQKTSSHNVTDERKYRTKHGTVATMRTGTINQGRTNQLEDNVSNSAQSSENQLANTVFPPQQEIFVYNINKDVEAIAEVLQRQLESKGKFRDVTQAMVERLDESFGT